MTTVLFHVQHFFGMGHLVRARALAEALADAHRVVLVSGGRLPAAFEPPAAVEVVELPPLHMDPDGTLTTRGDGPVDDRLRVRRRRLLDLYDRVAPDVVLVELYPFGRKKLEPELRPLLERARADRRRPLVVSSIRDILVTGRNDQTAHDDRAAARLSALIDLVLVHADRELVRLEDTFAPTTWPDVDIVYTGFVARERPVGRRAPSSTDGRLVVSAGGGWVGGSLMEAAIDAAPLIADEVGLETTLVTGPLLDQEERAVLSRRAAESEHVELEVVVPDLGVTLAGAAASISQCGYNTALDILYARVPAVVVPFGDARENEQLLRAERLRRRGVVEVVSPADLDGPALARAVRQAMGRPVPTVRWDLGGALRSSAIVTRALAAHRRLDPAGAGAPR